MTVDTAAPQTDTLVSTREVPWMKLGKLADTPMTAAEAAVAGGLNFTVEKRPLWFGDTDDTQTAQPSNRLHDRVAVVRTDTNEWLGVMSKTYPLLQYGEAFDFMDTVGTPYVAAGALKGGRQGFMVVEVPVMPFTFLTKIDEHKMYIVMRTSHDGSRAIEVMVMPLRMRCMNQLTLQSFSANVPHRWSIKHTSTMAVKLKDAQNSLERVTTYTDKFVENAERLIKVKITDSVAQATLEQVLPDRPRRVEQIERIITAWHESETVGFDFTGWGLVNAVSEYFDWGRAGGSPESRFVGALQGQTTNAINRVAGRLLSRV